VEYLILIALPFAMAVLNRWRGSRMDQLVGKNIGPLKNGAPVAAVGLMLMVMGLTMDPLVGFCTGVAYFAGEAFGWAKWVRSAPFWWTDWQKNYNRQWLARGTGKSSGIHQIANAVFKETEDFTNYAILALTLRGIWWYAPVYAVLVYFNVIPFYIAIPAVLAIGVLFPICYRIATQLPKRLESSIFFGIYMNNAEKLYGLAQGAVIAASFWLSM